MQAISNGNPCASCSIDQDCCTHLSGLRVTPAEFERCFADYADRLEICREGPVYVLTPKAGAPCPNWRDGGCAIYDVRPRECRLFPFTLYVERQSRDYVGLGYHCDTRCPLKHQLLCGDETARQLVEGFGREAFGSAVVRVHRESAWARWSRWARSLVGVSVRLVRKYFAGPRSERLSHQR